MRYLSKNLNSVLLTSSATYDKQSDRTYIKGILLTEQHRFCAYSEKYLCEIDEHHIEHFDPRLKETTGDNYYNWYATLPWMNSHKAKNIEPYLPILSPYAADLSSRIVYNVQANLFEPVTETDNDAQHLINFLGFNKEEVVLVRAKHIKRIQSILIRCNNSTDELLDFIGDDKNSLSFATALECVFNIDLTPYITAPPVEDASSCGVSAST